MKAFSNSKSTIKNPTMIPLSIIIAKTSDETHGI